MAFDSSGFARTCFLVFVAHLAIVFLLSRPIGCTARSENGQRLGSSHSSVEESAPHQLNLRLSGTSGEMPTRTATGESVDPPSRLVLPESKPAPPLVAPERAPEQTPNRQTVKDEAPSITAPPAEPFKPEISKELVPEKKSAKTEKKAETAKPARKKKADKALATKEESRPTSRAGRATRKTTPADSKPANNAKTPKTSDKPSAKPPSAPVSIPKESDPDPPAIPAKIADEPETVRARPIVSAVPQDKEILRAKPILPAELAEGSDSGSASVDSSPGESPTAGANMGAYQNTVRQMIQSRWNAPKGQPEAQMPEALITINRDGAIVYSRLQRSSGNDVLDRSAMEAVRLRSQLLPLPSEYPEERYDLVIKFQLD